MFKSFLLTSPMEELGSQNRVGLDFEHFRHERGGDSAELVEFKNDGWSPRVQVLSEGIENEAGDWGEFWVSLGIGNGRW